MRRPSRSCPEGPFPAAHGKRAAAGYYDCPVDLCPRFVPVLARWLAPASATPRPRPSARSCEYAETVTIRCTQRLLKALRVPPRDLPDVPASDDDWYANLIWLDRRKCLLLTHAGTLFPLFVADLLAADLRQLGAVLERNARVALYDERLPVEALGDLDGGAPVLARTASRRILGVMSEDAYMCEQVVASEGGLDSTELLDLNRRLRRNLHSVEGGFATSLEVVHKRLTR